MMRVYRLALLCHAARALQAPPRRAVSCRPAAAAPFSAELPDLSPSLQEALAKRNIQTPTPIQKVALLGDAAGGAGRGGQQARHQTTARRQVQHQREAEDR